MSDHYPSIGSLGVVGDGRSLALFDRNCGVQWFCPGRFDAAPALWPLLDDGRGGALYIRPAGSVAVARRYLGETAVLEYEWRTGAGRAIAHVCMTWPESPGGDQRLIFVLRGMTGSHEIELRFAPRPGFGGERYGMESTQSGMVVHGKATRLFLHASLPFRAGPDGDAWARGPLRAGETMVVCLSCPSAGGQALPEPLASERAVALVEETARTWRRWAAAIDWEGPYRDAVVRSAITLKLLIYEPSGAVVAAGTTSLPEAVGGVRNWDYRYTWLRDASFTLNALYQIGCRREASRWAQWLAETTASRDLPLPVMFGIDGGPVPPEREIAADGYRGSRPVRVGNAAERQFQLDVYGEVLDCLTICEVMGDEAMQRYWPSFRRLADFVAGRWRQPDRGIWEVRDRDRHFVYSKAMAWLALDRACRISRRRGLGGGVDRWTREATALRGELLERGVARDGHFVRAYGENELDASLLLLPVVGFIAGTDPRVLATIQRVQEALRVPGTRRGLLLRYPHDAGDGLPGPEGAFTICGFWLVEALALAGRWDDAEEVFQEIVGLAGDLGLFAEEIDAATGEQLGNFPQAFTHIGLINAALRLRKRSVKGQMVDPR